MIVAVAIGIAKMMSSFRKELETKPPNVPAPLLNAIQVYPETLQMTVQGFGTVKPRMEVQVVPQVSGKVIQCHPQLVNGGFFRAEEPLVVIEQTDYTLAVESADAAVAQARRMWRIRNGKSCIPIKSRTRYWFFANPRYAMHKHS
jgi:multidrug efflux pump subunit AcrA (membrane-fusion protein)